jgi:hypothetical protein
MNELAKFTVVYNLNVSIEIIQGGMREFMQTGKYPEYCIFHFPEEKKHWRIKIKSHPQHGFLCTKGNKIYEYHLSKKIYKIRPYSKNEELPFQRITEITQMMCD